MQPWDGEQVHKIINKFLNSPPGVIRKARTTMEIVKVVKVKGRAGMSCAFDHFGDGDIA